MSTALPPTEIPVNGVSVPIGVSSGQPYTAYEVYNASSFTILVTNWAGSSFYLSPGQDKILAFSADLGSATVQGMNNTTPGVLYLTGYTRAENPPSTGTAGSIVSVANGTVTVEGTPTVDANITNATLPVSGTLDANITNASIPVTGSLDANITNATIPVTGTVAVDTSGGAVAVAATGTVDANITNATLPVSGSLDANITNASIPVTGTLDANITNASIPVTGTVDATLTGPVGISSGSTINVVNSAAGGQTPLSATTTITTANATLSNSDYVLVALGNANGLPAGSSGNLVYDSNLTQALAPVGPTWGASSCTVGTAPGDVNVLNPGADTAEVVFYGTGSAFSFPQFGGLHTNPPVVFAASPNTTYTASALQNTMAATTAGGSYSSLRVFDQDGNFINQASTNPGLSEVASVTFTTGPTVTGLSIDVTPSNLVVPTGSTVSFSQIQLTQTSTVQPYQPGPLFNNIAFKQDGQNFYYLGETTALALADTGQALNTAIQPSTSINSTVPQLAIPDAPTLTVEGTAGTATYTYGWVTQTSTAQGVVSLASNPGVNIGTMDIASGAQVQLAAGTAVIGTVNAQGQVDVGTIDKITAGDLTIVNNSATNIPSGSEENYSMTMTDANTSYTAAPAVSSRTFFMIQNPSTETLSFGFGSTGNIFTLEPSQGYEEIVGTNPLITLAITVQGTIANQAVSIVTWE